ncbi:alpha/beta hydrolase [Xanthobacter sp. V4C-4]|uniref:alpha/beta fold hydrolase n=1 Tax=Xanthobacter cornucopiae TaxID=3119924 RepID=UPI00372C9BEB
MPPVMRAAEALLASIPAPRTIATSCGPLACVIEGAGPPLLALHGVMGGLDQSWLLARALWARPEGRTLIAIARPGYPGTPLETGRAADDQARAYAGLLDALGLDAAHVAAFSGGGPSALAFARQYPRRCRGLVLVSACTGRLETTPAQRARFESLSRLAGLPGIGRVPAWAMRQWPQLPSRAFIPDPGQRSRLLADPQAGPLFAALLLSSFTRMPARLPGTLNDVAHLARLPLRCDGGAAPVLAIHGTVDGVVPFAHAAGLARAMPHARVLALEGGTHMALFTHLSRVRAALARLPGADG